MLEKKYTPLQNAFMEWMISADDGEKFRELLFAMPESQQAAAVDKREKDRGRTLLHWTTIHGNIQAAKLLLECGADVNARSFSHDTPLHDAVTYGQSKLVKLLLESGADGNARSEFYQAPLHHVWQCDYNMAVLNALLASPNVDVNAQDSDGQSLLHHIAFQDDTDKKCPLKVVKRLVKAGADVNLRDHKDETPLHLAACHEINLDLVVFLLGVPGIETEPVSENGSTPMDYACEMAESDKLIKALEAAQQ